ncbi:SMI1/KNR4 family protein [Mesorhizobium sp.]|uniref:SMI1/KNR4 family protein n=1 Tax=Mesorhizobium sp. TaxID=1871066 RepID=UPI00257B6907|nr:SMI1/KNR4 family protein [Mesorhizobium sp.]
MDNRLPARLRLRLMAANEFGPRPAMPFRACVAAPINRAGMSVMDRSRRNVLIGASIFGALSLAGLLPTMCAMRQIRTKSPMAETTRPKRPPGEAKPLLEEDIAPVLARLDAWYAAHLPPDKYVFNPPATDAQLDAFESLIGLKMPRAYRDLYRWHDGENDDSWVPYLWASAAAAASGRGAMESLGRCARRFRRQSL